MKLRMRAMVAIVLDSGIARVTFGQMPRSVAVAFGLCTSQHVQGHGTADQRRGKRMLGLVCICRSREGVIRTPVQLLCPCHHDPCCAMVWRTVDEKADRRSQMRIGFRKVERGLFGLDAVEVGQQLQIFSKAGSAESQLESRPKMRLLFIRFALPLAYYHLRGGLPASPCQRLRVLQRDQSIIKRLQQLTATFIA